jgi:cyclopropane fatty-acyl-phospholipid synthase-like methyltransferase
MTASHSSTAAAAPGDRTGYWDDYYASRSSVARPLPSQFVTFVAGELTGQCRVVELGCGNGRDSIFFASYGHDVTGVDGSESAVKGCQTLAEALGVEARFLHSSIDDPELPGRLGRAGEHDGQLVIYARFFVHAITDEEEKDFFALATQLTSPGDVLAVEYRTVRDQSGAKVTDAHYRRFVAPSSFQANALASGFEVTYAAEGFGFAKYKQDDAYCARELFTRR